MAFLIYTDAEGHKQEQKFLDEIRIGSDPGNELVLPVDWNVAPQHAVITRSAVNRQYLLVNSSGKDMRVNGLRTTYIHVLHQKDEIQLGKAHLKLWEMRITYLPQGSRFIGRECLVCTHPFDIGDAVIACPRCSNILHRNCWFFINICANFTCEYPITERVMDAISSWVALEKALSESSELVEIRQEDQIIKEGVICRAGNRVDQVPFQVSDKVVYCPSPTCHAPFHLECWLLLSRCPVCGYEVRKLVDQVFSVG